MFTFFVVNQKIKQNPGELRTGLYGNQTMQTDLQLYKNNAVRTVTFFRIPGVVWSRLNGPNLRQCFGAV